MSKVEVRTYVNSLDNSMSIVAKLTREIQENVGIGLVQEVARIVAERYVHENYPALVSKIDQQAIANLVIAQAGRKIAEEMKLTRNELEKERHGE